LSGKTIGEWEHLENMNNNPCDYCGKPLEADFKEIDCEPINSDPFLPSEILRVHPEHIITLTETRELPDRRRIYRIIS